MGKWPFQLVLFDILVLLLLNCHANGNNGSKKSCQTPCSATSFPNCGSWLHFDNSKIASGVYLLGDSYANLTCLVHSLPKPTEVEWLYKTESDSEPREVTCTSMRKETDCSYNAIGEHKVRSTCLLKLASLEQTASYFCRAQEITSKATVITVFGISNLTVEPAELQYGEMGILKITVCGNPQPDVIWVNEVIGVNLRNGQSLGNYTALPLQHLITVANHYSPAVVSPYCYVAKLFISQVREADNQFTLVATNSVAIQTIAVSATVLNIPPPPVSSAVRSTFVTILTVTIFIHWVF